MKKTELAQYIDHTLLKPEATAEDVKALVADAESYGAFSVCVSPSQLPVKTSIKVATVCGFPSGAHYPEIKAAEAKQAVDNGADEVDMVINLANAKNHDWSAVEADVQAVRDAIPGALLKVILETAALTDEEITESCLASERAGADFVKTSTGFHPAGGASVHAIELMHAAVGGRLGIKASGGIRDTATAVSMIEAGATRIGASSTAAVIEDAE